MSEDDGLVCAYALDGRGGGRALDWPDIPDGEESPDGEERKEAVWVHLDRTKEPARSWLRHKSGLDPLVCEALLAKGTRPRCDAFGEGRQNIIKAGTDNPSLIPSKPGLQRCPVV